MASACEHLRAICCKVILPVTDGELKSIKYPHMFRANGLMLLNKIDLLAHLRFDVGRCIAYARRVHPGIGVLCVSAQTGEGMEEWYGLLRKPAARASLAKAQS